MIESGNRRASLLAAVALTALAASPSTPARDLGYPMPSKFSPGKRAGNNRREDSAKRHAKAKTAHKSRQQQRKRAKGK